jgi:AcrR family transcriptional regulator
MGRREVGEQSLPRRTQPRGKATREKLLLAARSLFAQDGYEGASIGDVARAAGVGVGTVYHHFADKRALLLELLDRDIAATHIQLVDDRGGPLVRALRSPDFFKALGESLRLVRGLRVNYPATYLVAVNVARRDAEVAQRLEAIEEKYLEASRTDLTMGIAEGRIRNDLNLDAAALVVYRSFEAVVREISAASDDAAEGIIGELADLLGRYLLVD